MNDQHFQTLNQTIQQALQQLGDTFVNNSSTAPNLECFRGKPGQFFQKLLDIFERIAQGESWSDEKKRKKLLSYLRDNAASKYDSIPQQNRNTYNELKNALLEKFQINLKDFALAALGERHQYRHESVTDYASDLKKTGERRISQVERGGAFRYRTNTFPYRHGQTHKRLHCK